MQTPLRTALIIIAFNGLWFAGCSEDAARTESGSSVEPAPKETTAWTAGRIVFEGIPKEGVTGREVIVIEGLEPAAKERLRRQRQLFEYKATGRNPEQADAERMAQADLPEQEARDFDGRWGELTSQFPEVLTVDLRIEEEGVDDDRIRKISSDFDLHKEYKELFRAIRWDNMKRAVEFIGAKLDTDGKAWAEKQYAEDAYEAEKAKVTLNWMTAVTEHLNAHVALANERIHGRNAHAQKVAEMATKAVTWEDYVDRHASQLIVDISKSELASATVEEEGTFEVDAQGDLLLRVEYGFRSAYFLIGDPAENRVSVADLNEWTNEPSSVR